MGNIGPGELLIIALIALLLFGAGRIADIGKGLGQGIKNFKQGLKDADGPENPAEKAGKKPARVEDDAPLAKKGKAEPDGEDAAEESDDEDDGEQKKVRVKAKT